MQGVMVPLIGSIGSTIFLTFFCFITLQLSAWFLLFNLSNYSIAHRISILTRFIGTENDQMVLKSLTKGPITGLKKLRTCGYMFDQICHVSNLLSATFSANVLVVLTVLMTFCASSLFLFMYSILGRSSHPFMVNGIYTFLAFFTGCIVMTIIILTAASGPITEVHTS